MKAFSPTYVFDSIDNIDSDFFNREKISCVLMDIDNTLVADNEPFADERAVCFIERLRAQDLKLCLISNNTEQRVASFNKDLGLKSVYRASKPFCRKINRAIKEMGANKYETLLIGDQLLTDILAGNRCGVRTALVTPINISKENTFFKFKRFIEKRLLNRNFR